MQPSIVEVQGVIHRLAFEFHYSYEQHVHMVIFSRNCTMNCNCRLSNTTQLTVAKTSLLAAQLKISTENEVLFNTNGTYAIV